MQGLSLRRQRGCENTDVLERLDAIGAAMDKRKSARLEKLDALERQVADIEAELDAILADLRTCADPALEDGLEADLVGLMDKHQATFEAMESERQ